MRRAVFLAPGLFLIALPSVAMTRNESASAPAPLSGKALFEVNCAGCHGPKGYGTRILSRRVPEGQAELEARKNLGAKFISLVVRRGLGSMPQIRKSELSDQELEAIAKYLENRT